MSLAAKVRGLEKRIADARMSGQAGDAIRVQVLRDDLVDSITTHLGEVSAATHGVVATQRRPQDTDDTLRARHDAEVLAAALKGSRSHRAGEALRRLPPDRS